MLAPAFWDHGIYVCFKECTMEAASSQPAVSIMKSWLTWAAVTKLYQHRPQIPWKCVIYFSQFVSHRFIIYIFLHRYFWKRIQKICVHSPTQPTHTTKWTSDDTSDGTLPDSLSPKTNPKNPCTLTHTHHQLNVRRHLGRHPARQPPQNESNKSVNLHPYTWSKNPL